MEWNLRRRTSKYDGAKDTESEVLASLEKSRAAQKISLGLFVDF
jgi:hypothetical protein